jgi:hypothetical protein
VVQQEAKPVRRTADANATTSVAQYASTYAMKMIRRGDHEGHPIGINLSPG